MCKNTSVISCKKLIYKFFYLDSLSAYSFGVTQVLKYKKSDLS